MRRVIVIGGGAAGYGAARALVPAFKDRAHVRLTLISQSTHHVVRPLLPGVAAGWTSPALSVVQLSSLRDFGPIDIVNERIVEVDVAAGVVRTDRDEYPYEYLLVALGRTARLPNGWGGHEHVQKFRTDADAAELRNRIGRAFDDHGSCSVAIIGGGPTGIDLAAALAGGVARRGAEEGAVTPAPDVTLYESAPRLLSRFPDGFPAYAAETLENLDVDLELNTRVAVPCDGGLELEDGTTVEYDVVVWSGGTRPAAPLQKMDLLRHDSGVLAADKFLRPPGHANIFLAGSSAHLTGAPPHSMGVGFNADSGRIAARNLLAAMCGRAPEEMPIVNRPTTVSVGRQAAVAQVRGRMLRGRSAWGLHRFSIAKAIPDWTNRLGVVGSWAQRVWEQFTRN